ncbi:radical SAM protein [Clostridium sp. MSJ-4]|uniref:Radical SAM protein n=1 Tax=Clostridium simiarum TaxID=2841506 RepID=A0ABS6EVP1_9CLOT|nr:radical SAM protein [Clostridium simiarum]MBU5590271.1 radical SAM protein [Clostridium simiarum]
MSIKETVEKGAKELTLSTIAELLDKKPEKNVEKLFSLARKLARGEEAQTQVENVYGYYKNNPATYEYIQNILKTTDKKCMKKFFVNFLGNATWYGMPKRGRYLEEEDTKVPFVILISPSMRCNLRCTGCYAADYDKKDDLTYEEVDRIVGEARDLGIYYIVVLGGEPFFNEYMLDIYEKYNDILFTPFTNGTLFDEKLADRVKGLGNVFPMFSLEGFEEETDSRRGKGTFAKVMHGMELLKERGVLFGVSSATSKFNVDTVVSDEFIDMLIEKGCKMSWYFMYMPVGDNPDVNSMLTPEQRVDLGRKTRKIRSTKPYFTIDFFNDAPYVGGCIAGKYYCHINSKGDVEPCIFAHFACDNVKDKSLIEVFRGPFFKELRARQPYNENLLLPCMMVDNTEVIREVIEKTKAYATHPGANRMINDEEFMKELDNYAKEFKPYAEKAWKDDFNCTGNYSMSKG